MKEYVINEKGEKIRIILDIEEYNRLREAAEEAKRMTEHPGIAFRGPDGRRRAWVPGTAFDVWEIVAGYAQMGRERVLRESNLTGCHMDIALAYYEAYPKEINEKVEDNDRPPEYWRERCPGLDIEVVEY